MLICWRKASKIYFLLNCKPMYCTTVCCLGGAANQIKCFFPTFLLYLRKLFGAKIVSFSGVGPIQPVAINLFYYYGHQKHCNYCTR